jgi:hypothetical protein
VRGSQGQAIALSSVETVSPTDIRIRFVSALPANEKCRISYGHPYSAPLGTIATIQKALDGNEELVLAASFAKQLKPLMDEGAFFVTNTTGVTTRVPIRGVREENGTTLLRYEPRELRQETRFEIGQQITAQRAFSYGNLRDSDPEPSVYTFGDGSYGTRAGQPYPLWNWCVLFSDLEVGLP